MSSFTTIQDRVKRRLIDLPTAVLTEVPVFINEAITDLEREHNFRCMEAGTFGITAVGSHNLIAIPTNNKEYRGVPYFQRLDLTIQPITISNLALSIIPDIQFQDTGEPQAIYQNTLTGYFEVYPYSDSNSDYGDGQYRVSIPLYGYLPNLVAGTDENWFTSNAERYIVEWATAQGFGLDWDEEHMAIALQKAEVEKRKVILQDKRSRLAGVNELAFHRDVFSSRLRN